MTVFKEMADPRSGYGLLRAQVWFAVFAFFPEDSLTGDTNVDLKHEERFLLGEEIEETVPSSRNSKGGSLRS